MDKRVLILSAGVGAGHNTAARALEDEFCQRTGVEVVRQDVLELTNEAYRTVYDTMYQVMVKRFPVLVGWSYDSADVPFAGESLWRKAWDMLNTQPLLRFIRDFDPDISVCTHFMPSGVVAQMMALNLLHTTLSVVTTDYDFQGLWLSQTFHRYFVARDETKARLAALGVDPARVTVSGIPIDPLFAEPVDREAVLARYELRPDLPILLISAGAVGGGPARGLVAQALQLRHQVQTVVVCGRNEELRRDVETLILPQADRFRILGFSTAMPDLVRIATLFVGKPGGLTASECMAAGTPIAINTPTPGQEERNSDYLLEEGAAIRCNYVETFAFKVDALLDDPERLERLHANARRIGRPDAAGVVVNAALAERSEPVTFDRDTQLEIAEAIEHGLAEVPGRGEAQAIALFDDGTGAYLGSVTPIQSRTLRRLLRRANEPAATTMVDQATIERLREQGLDTEVLAMLSRRVAERGPFKVRRVRV